MANLSNLRQCQDRPRVFVTTDIANEPDDAESLVRYLLYTNELDTQGLVACTSTHMKRRVCPEIIVAIVEAYGEVVQNLNAHTHPNNQYPSAKSLLNLVAAGPELYGKEALKPQVPLSSGAKLLIERLEESPKPLWVLGWGGMNVLAQALHHIKGHRSPSDGELLRSKLRVYAISDQDDTGHWIRKTFPDVFYICSIHGWNQYHLATWTGISGDMDGSDTSQVSKDWYSKNIQLGPLGSAYPDHKFLVEGDTPTFLYLIQNGLGSPEHPQWGSWGGRYLPIDLSEETHQFVDAVDEVKGQSGENLVSNYATIWRWRNAFQNDFAARMQWTLTSDISKANHAPVVIINDSTAGPEPLSIHTEAGSELYLDASASYDPDGDSLTFRWFQYREVTTGAEGLAGPQVMDVAMENVDKQLPWQKIKAKVPPPEKCAIDFLTGKPQETGQSFHLILEVKDNGTPSMISYKRVVIHSTNKRLGGGRYYKRTLYTTADWLEEAGVI